MVEANSGIDRIRVRRHTRIINGANQLMDGLFSRNELIWGEDVQKELSKKHVAVFGLGGVGGFALESLARCGVGEFTLVDFDTVSESNINRQIIALDSTVGFKKVDLFKKRLKDINPDIKLNCFDFFYEKSANELIFNKKIDYVADAIDTMRSKIELLQYCHAQKIPVVSSLGAGSRFDPTQLYICDISEIKKINCNFVKNALVKLNKLGISSGITVVCSLEKPKSFKKIRSIQSICLKNEENVEIKKISPGSLPFTPAVAGYYMGYYIAAEFAQKKD